MDEMWDDLFAIEPYEPPGYQQPVAVSDESMLAGTSLAEEPAKKTSALLIGLGLVVAALLLKGGR